MHLGLRFLKWILPFRFVNSLKIVFVSCNHALKNQHIFIVFRLFFWSLLLIFNRLPLSCIPLQVKKAFIQVRNKLEIRSNVVSICTLLDVTPTDNKISFYHYVGKSLNLNIWYLRFLVAENIPLVPIKKNFRKEKVR